MALRTAFDFSRYLNEPAPSPLMPWPAEVQGFGETKWVTATAVVFAAADNSPRIVAAVELLQDRLGHLLNHQPSDAVPLQVAQSAAATVAEPVAATPIGLRVECQQPAAQQATHPSLGMDESYRLSISADGILLQAPDQWGVLHGLTSLSLLWQPSGRLPQCEINDAPRFAWRGLMLDPARRFLPFATLRQSIDAMSLCKLNVLHLHLSDDQGFRFRSNRYPELASSQSYSAKELRLLVDHAADRGVRIVPELDVPGHCTSWLSAYPQWGCDPAGTNDGLPETQRFGVHQACLDPTNPQVLAAIEHLFGELAEVFPDSVQHIGGDEVHPNWWAKSAGVQKFMAAQGLKQPADLQAHFNNRLANQIAHRSRRLMAWDEVLHPEFCTPSIVQNWRGATTRDRALAAGHDVVVSSGYYLDLMYPADVHYEFDPAAPLDQLLGQEDALLADPRFANVADGMRWTLQWREAQTFTEAASPGQVLGGEACLWGELVDAGCLDIRLWSRMPAVAERLWSPASQDNKLDMYRRMGAWQRSLAPLVGIDLWSQQRRALANAGIAQGWLPLCELLEPVKWYARLLGQQALQARLGGREMPQARPYKTTTPLTGWVDYLWPESIVAARLLEWLGNASNQQIAQLADTWLLLSTMATAPTPLRPFAARLESLAGLLKEVALGEQTAAQALPWVQTMVDPVDEVVLAVVPPVVQWLQAQ